MKRLGNGTFENIADIYNLYEAHYNARRGKAHYKQVKDVDANLDYYMYKLQKSLIDKTFTTSEYLIEDRVINKKERRLYILPYYPDRIVQHALLQVVGDRLEKSLIRDTFQSIKGRGTYDAKDRILCYMKNNEIQNWYKLDIKKYYPNVDNKIMKDIMRKYIKDRNTLLLFDDIIDSTKGLPIGNYTSQILGNIYLNDLDWYIKQKLGIKGYFRYCDDLLLFNVDKEKINNIKHKLKGLNLSLNEISMGENAFEFIGFIFNNKEAKLRNNIIENMKSKRKELSFRKSKCTDRNSVYSYFGMCKQTNELNIWNNIFKPYIRSY